MTLLDIRTAEILPAPAAPASAEENLRRRALAAAEDFRQFILGKRTRAHAQFMLNYPAEPDGNDRHTYFAEALLAMPGVGLPESLHADSLADRRDIDGQSIALYRDNNLGLFVARQVIFTEVPAGMPSDAAAPAMYVDYLAGSFNAYEGMERAIVTVAA